MKSNLNVTKLGGAIGLLLALKTLGVEAQVTMAEIASHGTPSDCWTAVYGEGFDVTDFAPNHPAGATILTSAMCGKDATTTFDQFHGDTPGYLNTFPGVTKLGAVVAPVPVTPAVTPAPVPVTPAPVPVTPAPVPVTSAPVPITPRPVTPRPTNPPNLAAVPISTNAPAPSSTLAIPVANTSPNNIQAVTNSDDDDDDDEDYKECIKKKKKNCKKDEDSDDRRLLRGVWLQKQQQQQQHED